MRPIGVWFGRLAMAGACLVVAGCGRGDVPDPDSDSKADTAEGGRKGPSGPAAPPEAPALARNDAPAEPEKPAAAPEAEKSAPTPKGDASGTDEMLKMGGAQPATPPAADAPGGGGSAPAAPGRSDDRGSGGGSGGGFGSGGGSGGAAAPQQNAPGAPGQPVLPGGMTPAAPATPGGATPGQPVLPGGMTPAAPAAPGGITPGQPVTPGGGTPGQTVPPGRGDDGGRPVMPGGGGSAQGAAGFGGLPAPGGPGGGMMPGPGGDSSGATGKNAFHLPNTAVNAFLAALKAKDKDRLKQSTATRAPTEADEKHRKIFSSIVEGSISDDELDELSKALDGFQVISVLPAKSTRRIGVVVSKMSGRDRLQRTIITRQEVDGWKVLDIENMYEFKPAPVMRGRGTTRKR